MDYTVKQLAKLSGVSVRTLHYYDEIGLLKPAYHGENGYRYYQEEQLLMLQQILFYRELGIELRKIQMILGRSEFDKIAALNSHRKVLLKERRRIRGLIETIDKTIEHLQGERKMSDQEMYRGFSNEKQREYEKYLKNHLGKKVDPFITQTKENTKNWSKEDWEELKKESEELHEQIAKAIDNGLVEESSEVQSLISQHFEMIKRFYTPTKEVYSGLGDLYVEHPDFRKMYEGYHPKLAEFLSAAMKLFAEREL